MTKYTPHTLGKYEQRIVDSYRYPLIVIEKSKHADTHYVASSIDDLWKLCLRILKTRKDEECWYSEPEMDKLGVELTPDQIAALPEPYRTDAIRVVKSNKVKREVYADELTEWQMICNAVKYKDGPLAYEILRERGDHEYEQIEFVQPEPIK